MTINLNKIDTELYAFLKFFSNGTAKELYADMQSYKLKHNKEMFEWKIIEYSILNNYIYIGDNKISNGSYVITEKGLEILRNLDNIKFNLRNFWISIGISILALLISIISLLDKISVVINL